MIIGTQALLYQELPKSTLIMIDEQHRFGSIQRQKIDELTRDESLRAHFLQFSATPIPRTLYMSLSGIKDMSVINTPPKNRLPIKTFVGELNETSLKNAITHELDREGQVFYLYNRVETIEEYKLHLHR